MRRSNQYVLQRVCKIEHRTINVCALRAEHIIQTRHQITSTYKRVATTNTRIHRLYKNSYFAIISNLLH